MLVSALDIGASSVKHAIVDVSGHDIRVIGAINTQTLASQLFVELQQVVFTIVAEALYQQPDITTVGISTAGQVDQAGKVIRAGAFIDYQNICWRARLTANFPVISQVTVVNDGQAAAWAEFSGITEEKHSHIHAVVGTGVGGGIIYHGELYNGSTGLAGHIGHLKLTAVSTESYAEESLCNVESLAAAPEIIRNFQENSGLKNISSLKQVVEEAHHGNPTAIAAFVQAGWWLGIGLGNAMNVLNPSHVSVGGGVLLASEQINAVGDGGPYMDSVIKGISYAAHKVILGNTKIQLAHFGNAGGVVGAAQLAARNGT